MSLQLNKIYNMDCREGLKMLDSDSIDLAITSPPYWGLRDYGKETECIWDGDENCEHEFDSYEFKQHSGRGDAQKSGKYSEQEPIPDKILKRNFCQKCGAFKGQLGLEPTPDLYISHLLQIFRELKRVLKPSGSFFLNIGDTFSGSNQGYGMTKRNVDSGFQDVRKGYFAASKQKPPQSKMNIPRKSLCMIPERVALAMINEGWILRNKIIWHKPNSMPSSVKDRLNTTWEYLYHFTIKPKYFYDLDAIREKYEAPINRWGGEEMKSYKGKMKYVDNPEVVGSPRARAMKATSLYRERSLRPNKLGKNPGDFIKTKNAENAFLGKPPTNYYRRGEHKEGKNPGDIFEINTSPFPDAHFAVFPPELLVKPIKAACPKEVCKKCGKPRERIVKTDLIVHKRYEDKGKARIIDSDKYIPAIPRARTGVEGHNEYRTIGWTDCGCNSGFKPGIVLDPFIGAGTTALVCKYSGKFGIKKKVNFIGFEISKEYCKIANKRLAQRTLWEAVEGEKK